MNQFHFELLIQRLNLYFSTFELLTRSRKIKSLFSSCNSKLKSKRAKVTNLLEKFLFFHFWGTNSKLKKRKLYFELLIQKIKKTKSCFWIIVTAQKSFSLRPSSVIVTKFAVSCWFVHIYWRNPYWKISFFVQ